MKMLGLLSLIIIVTLGAKKSHKQVKNSNQQNIDPVIQPEQLLKEEDYFIEVENFLDSEIDQLIKESDLNQKAEQILSNKQDESLTQKLKKEINEQQENNSADISSNETSQESQQETQIKSEINEQESVLINEGQNQNQQNQQQENDQDLEIQQNCPNTENCEAGQKTESINQSEISNDDSQQHNQKSSNCGGDSQNDDISKGCLLGSETYQSYTTTNENLETSQSQQNEQQENSNNHHHDHEHNDQHEINHDDHHHDDLHDHDLHHDHHDCQNHRDDHTHDHQSGNAHDNHNHEQHSHDPHDHHYHHDHHDHDHHDRYHHKHGKFDHKHDNIQDAELVDIFSQVQFPDLSFIFDKQKIQKHLTDYLPTDKYLAMIYGVILTQLPSFPTFLILLAVLKGKKQLGNKSVLNNMIAFSFGTMLGDVFFHMLPQIQEQEHILDIHDHDDHETHSHTLSYPTLYIILGILIFVFIDLLTIKIQESQRLVRKKNKNKRRNQKKNQKNKQKEEENLTQAKTKPPQEEQTKKQTKKQDKKTQPAENKPTESKPTTEQSEQDENLDEQDDHDNHDHHDHSHDSGNSIMTFLFCDFLHNITDGIALGATFSLGIKQGIVTTIAIFFHEIPHEIGDFAYLIKRNQSIFKVFLTQVATSAGCFLGAIFSFQYSQSQQFELLCLTCGSFIYVSLTNILPEIKFGFAFKPSLKRLFKTMFSIIFGLFLMYKVGQLE
ncbi:hypothetical protein pb186bvf_018434 [Paramecium bursaria]